MGKVSRSKGMYMWMTSMPDSPVRRVRAVRVFPGLPREEMKAIMKSAVDRVYQLLVLRDESPEEYESKIRHGERYTANWDKPRMPRTQRRRRVAL